MASRGSLQKTCFVCNQLSKQRIRSSPRHSDRTGSSDIIDLEGRPVELTQAILKERFEVCPHCGYLAEDISERTIITRDFLQSQDFCRLQTAEIPLSSSRYLRAALIQLAEKNREKAIDCYISAAWCADSSLHRKLAICCRRKALSLLFAGNRSFTDIPRGQWIAILDTIRRCDDFDAVISHVTRLKAIADPVLQGGLDYELFCAKRHDGESHTNRDLADYISRSVVYNADDELVIGSKSYSVDDDCYGTGWNWVAETRTLILSNYHGPGIEASGDITIQLDQIENQIFNSRGPGICIHQGNLKISGLSCLSIQGQAEGIVVESGNLEIAGSLLIIRTKECGIFTSGAISATNGSVFQVSSKTIAIKSASGGLNLTNQSALKIDGTKGGVELAGDLNISGGAHKIESSDGCGILIHHGSLVFSQAALDSICGDTCIHIEDGSLSWSHCSVDLNGTSGGVRVHGSCSLKYGMGSISGTEYSFFVSSDMEISGIYTTTGKTAIAVEGNLQIQNGSVTASGETGISIGGNLNYAGINLVVTGDTAMQIGGNAEISDGQIKGDGRTSGLVVNGTYTQSGGSVFISGGRGDGIRISGKMMHVCGGATISASGHDNGLVVAGHVIIESINLLSASGNIGFSVGKSLKFETGNMRITGEKIGLFVNGGNLIIGLTNTLKVTGDVGIFTTNDIGIHGGLIQVTGRSGGIVSERGNLIINNGDLSISGDHYGILLHSGSMKILTAIILITTSGKKDSGGCGIAVEKGTIDAHGIMTIYGESYGISAPCGDISLSGKVDAYGFRAGILGRALTLKDTSLTAHGKRDGAVILTDLGSWNEGRVVVLAGKSEKTAKDKVYSGQPFVHAFTVNEHDTST